MLRCPQMFYEQLLHNLIAFRTYYFCFVLKSDFDACFDCLLALMLALIALMKCTHLGMTFMNIYLMWSCCALHSFQHEIDIDEIALLVTLTDHNCTYLFLINKGGTFMFKCFSHYVCIFMPEPKWWISCYCAPNFGTLQWII